MEKFDLEAAVKPLRDYFASQQWRIDRDKMGASQKAFGKAVGQAIANWRNRPPV